MKIMSSYFVALFVLIFVTVTSASSQGKAPRFSDWEPLAPLAPPINSEYDDQAAVL